MDVKRLNYFHYQFLQQGDFTDEQNYHLSMRRRHNQDFHTWGRVTGLDVSFTAGDRKVTISPGMAVDSEGREIILESNYDVDLQGHAGGAARSVYLVLAYKEEPTDPTLQAGVSGNTRVTESFQTEISVSPPADPSMKLILAKITLNPGPPASDGAVTSVDSSERTEAGAKIGVSTFPGLKLMVLGHGGAEWPELKGVEVSAPGSGLQGISVNSRKTSFSGDVVVNGDLTVKGVVNKTDELTIKDNIIRVNSYEPPVSTPPTPLNINGGLEVFRGGTAPNAQIIWDESVDKWKIGTVGSLVDIAYGTNWDNLTNNAVTNLHRHSKLVSANGAVDPALTVDNAGKVGIGTTTPADKLDVAGVLRILTGSNPIRFTSAWSGFPDPTTNQAEISNDTETYKTLMIIGNKSAGLGRRVSVWDRLEVNGSQKITGNLGVGVDNPSMSLQVNTISLWNRPAIGGAYSNNWAYLHVSNPHSIIWNEGTHMRFGVETGVGSGYAERLRITSDGELGIGTPDPKAKLQVVGGAIMPQHGNTDETGILFPKDPGGGAGDKGWIRYYARAGEDTTLEIGTSNDLQDHIALMPSGNVGIGTTNPESKLDVRGAIRVTGQIKCAQWKVTRVLRQEPGPLSGTGLGGSFTSEGGTLLIFAFGSGWSNTINKQIGMQINVDNMMMGAAKVFTNEASSHKSFVGTPIVITSIGAGSHTLNLFRINSDTQTDGNDFFDVTVLELPFR